MTQKRDLQRAHELIQQAEELTHRANEIIGPMCQKLVDENASDETIERLIDLLPTRCFGRTELQVYLKTRNKKDGI